MSTDTRLSSHPGILHQWVRPRSVPGALEDCCAVIPTFKRADEIHDLVELLAARAGDELADTPSEVVIIDGTPDDSIEKRLLRFRHQDLPFELRYARTPAGLTRQRNFGIDLCSKAHVFFLDDDSRPEPGYFRTVREIFAADTERRVGAVGGYVLDGSSRAPRIPFRWRFRMAVGLAPRIGAMRYSHSGTAIPRCFLQEFKGVREVDTLPGCAMTFRREVLEQERFSEFFSGYSQGEDLEMCLRVGRRWKVLLAGEARLLHVTAPGGRPTSFRKGRMEVVNRMFIWNRHSRGRARLIDKVRLAADVALLFFADMVRFIAKPWRTHEAAHAMGVAAGALSCLAGLPAERETPPRPPSAPLSESAARS
jgi:GT2 family glycosyltransferase